MSTWFKRVSVGHGVHPKPLWNNHQSPHRRLRAPCKVLGIKHSESQSGVSFCVRTVGGIDLWLDAAWFLSPREAGASLRAQHFAEHA